MSFSTSLSGLRAAQADLTVTSNNVANVGAIGFKRSRVIFGDIMPPAPSAAGLGTHIRDVQQIFTQGGYQGTDRDLDVAITGSGFFMTRDAANGGRAYFTRAGAFEVDNAGYLVDPSRAYVQVLPVGGDDIATARSLQLPATSGAPRATTAMTLAATLPASTGIPANAFDPADPDSYNFTQDTTVTNSAGNSLPATLWFTRTGPDAWDVRVGVNGDPAGSAIPLAFNAAGQMTAPAGPVSSGSTAPAFTLDLTGTTQAGSSFTVSGITHDGFAPARFHALDIAADGQLTASFSDGSTQLLGRLLVADFANPGGLRQEGDARWTMTGDSGPATVAQPGRGGVGLLQTGMLEGANVDLTEELVGLITAQRNFQANAKAIETANQMTQTVVGMF